MNVPMKWLKTEPKASYFAAELTFEWVEGDEENIFLSDLTTNSQKIYAGADDTA